MSVKNFQTHNPTYTSWVSDFSTQPPNPSTQPNPYFVNWNGLKSIGLWVDPTQ